MYCAVPDCIRPADGRYCCCHRKRLQRGQSLGAPLDVAHLSPRGRVLEAAIALVEAESDEDHQRAWVRLRKAALAWLLGEAATVPHLAARLAALRFGAEKHRGARR